MPQTAFHVPIAFTLGCWVAACGGSGSAPTSPSSPSGPAGPSAAVTVSIVGERGAQSFAPNPAAASRGQTIAWRNTDGVVHRIVFNDESVDTGNIAPGAASAPIVLPTDGANYHCVLHPGMVGAIASSSGTPPPCEGPYC
jgi:plastocyanin